MQIINCFIDNDIIIERVLGKGGEGIIYLARDQSSGEKLTVKIFHEPVDAFTSQALHLYEHNIGSNKLGLPAITLLKGDDQIIGVKYKYLPLHHIHWRVFENFDIIAQSMFGNYCRMQHYLLSRCGLALTDPALCNFMMTDEGEFQFVDFGCGIKQVSHPRITDFGQVGYGFVILLAEIYHKNPKNDIALSNSYSYDHPCRYSFYEGLDEIAEQHPWVKDVLLEVRRNSASVFLNAELYKSFAEKYPCHVRFPWWIIQVSTSLNFAVRIKNSIRG